MSRFWSLAPAAIALAGLLSATPAAAAAAADCPAFLNHDFKKLRSSQSINLCKEYAGRPLLVVNTASHCGYTPQFKGLEALQQNYQPRAGASSSASRPTTSSRRRRTRRKPPTFATSTTASRSPC